MKSYLIDEAIDFFFNNKTFDKIFKILWIFFMFILVYYMFLEAFVVIPNFKTCENYLNIKNYHPSVLITGKDNSSFIISRYNDLNVTPEKAKEVIENVQAEYILCKWNIGE